MPRQLKPQKVDQVGPVQIGGPSVDVLLDRNSLDFYAKFEDQEVRAKTAEEAKKLAREMLKNYKPPSWEQRMWFRSDHDGGHHQRTPGTGQAQCGISFGRYERTFVQGKEMARPHPLDAPANEIGPNRRDKRFGYETVEEWQKSYSGWHFGHHDGEPYDQARWDRLCALRDAIQGLHQKLVELGKNPALLSTTLLLLPPNAAGESDALDDEDPDE